MVDPNSTTSIIVLHVNGINFPQKAGIIRIEKKYAPTIRCLWETSFEYKDTDSK